MKEKAEKLYVYRDNSSLFKWVRGLLILLLVISVAAVISDILERKLLLEFKNGVYKSQEDAIRAGDLSDARQRVVGISYFVTYLITVVFVGRFINLSNKNSRALGATGMEFSPAWAVGWYFIPFASLWKPYQAMREIYKTSINRLDWKNVKTPYILKCWWALWIISNILGQASSKFSLRAKELEEIITANGVDMVSYLVDIPSFLVFLILLTKIYNLQKQKY